MSTALGVKQCSASSTSQPPSYQPRDCTSLVPVSHRPLPLQLAHIISLPESSNVVSFIVEPVKAKIVKKKYKLLLPAYSGKGRMLATLRVDDMLGPKLPRDFLSEGLDLRSYVRHVFQDYSGNKKCSAIPRPAEIKTSTPARLLHITLLNSDCRITTVENSMDGGRVSPALGNPVDRAMVGHVPGDDQRSRLGNVVAPARVHPEVTSAFSL